MCLDESLNNTKVSSRETEILRQFNFGFHPEFSFAIPGMNVDVHAWLFTREEVKPESMFSKQSRTHIESILQQA